MPLNAYHGATESDHTGDGLRLSVTAYTGQTAVPEHAHTNAYICIGIAGGFVERSGRIEHEVHAHDLVYHPPGHVHSDRFFDRGGRCLNIEMDASWLAQVPPRLLRGAPVYASDPATRRLGRALLRESGDADVTLPSIDGLLLELFGTLNGPARRRYRQPPRWLLDTRDYLRATYTERHRLHALAQMAGVHPVHLAREFRRQFGCPIREYVCRCRVEAATELLAGSEMALVEIGLRLGFCSQSHFSRVFQARTGVAPGAYRRLAQSTKR